MLSERELSAAVGSTAYDDSGSKIGTVEHFYVDDRTGAPTWVALTTGLFGTRQSVAPAADASFAEGDLRLPVTADAVKNAPHVAGDHLDPQEEAELRRHYGLGTDQGLARTWARTWAPAGTPDPTTATSPRPPRRRSRPSPRRHPSPRPTPTGP